MTAPLRLFALLAGFALTACGSEGPAPQNTAALNTGIERSVADVQAAEAAAARAKPAQTAAESGSESRSESGPESAAG